MKYLLLVFVLLAAGCAGIADGKWERQFDQADYDEQTQIPDRQDYRTFRQQLPDFLLP